MKNIVVLTGAGMSAESGLKTFREAGGLWEGHDVMKVASPQGWNTNKELVLEFYNQRRAQLKGVTPNKGHIALAELESKYHVHIVTQNVDDLHERAGSTRVLHLHGELKKVRSEQNAHLITETSEPIFVGDKAADGHQLRPHIVWFGEDVSELTNAITITKKADLLIIIGTSMQVYPANNLIHYAPGGIPIYFIDPHPSISENNYLNLKVIAEPAGTGVPKLVTELLSK